MNTRKKLDRSMHNFLSLNQKMANKYGATISVGFSTPFGEKKEIVIAKPETSLNKSHLGKEGE